MKRKLIIDGNAVYEIDEECMVRQRLRETEELPEKVKQKKERESQMNRIEK